MSENTEEPRRYSRRRLLTTGGIAAGVGAVAGVAGGIAFVQGGASTPQIGPSAARRFADKVVLITGAT